MLKQQCRFGTELSKRVAETRVSQARVGWHCDEDTHPTRIRASVRTAGTVAFHLEDKQNELAHTTLQNKVSVEESIESLMTEVQMHVLKQKQFIKED